VTASDCPSPEELAGLVEGLLSGDALERVAAHVDACPACLAAAQEFRPTDVVVTALRRGAAPTAPPPTDRQDRYTPLRLHAAGGLGEVHVAEDTELGRRVALKRIRPGRADDPESRRRFLREAEVTARLEHPGVVPVHGLVWDAQGRPRYAMRFVDGESLRDAIKAFHAAEGSGRDPGERALALRGLLARFVAVCQTVAYAHSKGVVHRDIKPANVMLGQFGETLVVDWGLAKEVGSGPAAAGSEDTARGGAPDLPAADDTGGTEPGAVVGTRAYMSPEQAAGRHDEVGPASDVYMLGGTLYTILTGRPPFDGGAGVERGEAAPPRVSRSVPAALEAVCLRAMAGRPADRYQSAAEVGAEVERWLAGEPVRAYPERWPARAARWARRHRVAVAGLAVGLLVAAVLGSGGGVWLAREAADRRAERARLQAKDRDAVAQALTALPVLVRTYRFPEAEGLVNQTSVGLSEFATDEDRARLADALADVRLARELDAIRLEKTAVIGTTLITAAVVSEYRAAFERRGLNTADEVEVVGRRVAASPVREVLVAALDDWLSKEPDVGRRDRLARIAKAADPDPWRDQFRDALARRDWDALGRLAAKADVARLSPAALVALGLSLGTKTPEAADLFTRAQVHYPADYWLNFWLVAALRHNGRITPAEVVYYYRVCTLARPDAAPAYHNLGAALHDVGKDRDSEAAYRRAIELDPKFALPHKNLGLLFVARGDLARAEAAFRQAIKVDPRHVSAHYNLGNALQVRGDWVGAEAAYGRAIELDPKFAEAPYALGVTLHRRGDRAGAEAAFRRATEVDPRHVSAHYNLGDALRVRGDLAGAEAQLRRVVELDPKHVLALNNLGTRLSDRGDLAGAEPFLRRAIEVEPGHALANFNLGNLLIKRGDLAEAEACYRRIIEADPAFPQANFNLAYLLRARGDHAGAAAAYRREIKLDPKYAPAHYNLGSLLHEQGDFSGAVTSYRRVLELEPRNVWAHDNLAAALLSLGRFDDVRAAAKRALDLFPPGQPGHDAAASRLRQAEQMLRLDPRLPAVLRGEDRPADLTEHATFAELAAVRRRHAGSARLYEELFRKDPTAAESNERLYNAICSAALAGCGQGEDDPAPDTDERVRLRRQALDWLQADLRVRTAALAAAVPKVREVARRVLRHWQSDPDLTGVRDAAGLAALPDDEWDAWRRFWDDVAAALAPERK
jgi:tetratricopeptide (TPR) repeat protein/tRNA A-37 threonylcarbamoyl transferase component Bud32